MSDSIKGYIVILEDDIRGDDAQPITDAIAMIKGVLKVTPVVRDVDDLINRERIRHELGQKLWDVLYPKKGVQP